tara:strand:- start:15600 stop:17093 length:1494 start_codon:yes stop_codon:yes gene_type:complete
MPGKGNYTAFQKLKPITTDFGDLVEKPVEAMKARDAAELAEDTAKKEKLAKQFGIDYAGLVDVVTKTKSIDEAYARGINSARDSMGQIYKDIEKTPSLANDVKSQIKLQNLKNYSKNLKLVSDRYTEYATRVSTGMGDGTLSNWNSDVLSDLDSIFTQANLDVKVDPETGLPIAVTAVLDKNGQPTGELREINLVEVLDGRGLTNTVATFDFQASVSEIGASAGKDLQKTVNGFSHIVRQDFEDAEEGVRNMVHEVLGNEINPSAIAKSIWSDAMGKDPKKLTTVDMKSIEDFYVKSIEVFYDEKHQKTTDFSAQRDYTKDKEAKEKEAAGGLQLRTDEDGTPTKENLVGVSGDLQGPALQYTLPRKGKDGKKKDFIIGIKGQNQKITDLYLTDGGKIAYEVTNYTKAGKPTDYETMQAALAGGTADVKDFTSSSSTEGGLNTTELNEIARNLDLKDAGELKKELERVRDEKMGSGLKEEKTKTNTSTDDIDTSKYE